MILELGRVSVETKGIQSGPETEVLQGKVRPYP